MKGQNSVAQGILRILGAGVLFFSGFSVTFAAAAAQASASSKKDALLVAIQRLTAQVKDLQTSQKDMWQAYAAMMNKKTVIDAKKTASMPAGWRDFIRSAQQMTLARESGNSALKGYANSISDETCSKGLFHNYCGRGFITPDNPYNMMSSESAAGGLYIRALASSARASNINEGDAPALASMSYALSSLRADRQTKNRYGQTENDILASEAALSSDSSWLQSALTGDSTSLLRAAVLMLAYQNVLQYKLYQQNQDTQLLLAAEVSQTTRAAHLLQELNKKNQSNHA